MNNSTQLFSKRLTERTSKRGDLKLFADSMGVQAASLHKYLKAETSPSLDTLDKFAGAMGIEPWRLIHPSEKPPVSAEKYEALEQEQARALKEIETLKAAFRLVSDPRLADFIAVGTALNDDQLRAYTHEMRVELGLDDVDSAKLKSQKKA